MRKIWIKHHFSEGRRIGKSRLAEEFDSTMKTLTFIGLPPSGEKKTSKQEKDYFAHQFEINTGFRGFSSCIDLHKYTVSRSEPGPFDISCYLLKI